MSPRFPSLFPRWTSAMKKLTAFVCFLSFVIFADGVSAQVVIRQAGGGGVPIMTSQVGGFGGSYIPDDLGTMLALPQIATELKLTSSQQEELQKIRQQSQEAMQKMWQEMRQPAGEGAIRQFDAATWQKTQAAQQKARKEADENALAVLDDKQKNRLKEIRVQIALRNRGVTSLGAGGGVFGDAINLTDDQKKKQQEIQQELQRMMAELKEEMEQEALDEVLTDSQLATLKKLRGEYYVIKRPDYSGIYGRNQTPAGRLKQGAQKLLDDVKKDFEDKKAK